MPSPMPPFCEKQTNPKPKSAKELPAYLKSTVGGFFSRLIYILKLVWETKPSIFIALLVLALLDGVMPIIGSLISAELLNRLANAYSLAKSGASVLFGGIVVLLIVQIVYLAVKIIISNIENIVTRTSGELVVNHIRLKIMNKAKDIDLASFDSPDFYEKLENANREASMRPVQILTSTLKVISTLISLISFIAVLWAVNPAVPFIILLFAIPGIAINFVYRSKYYNYILKTTKERRRLNYYSHLMTNKDLAKEIRIFDLSDSFLVNYKSVFDGYYKGVSRLFRREALWNAFVSLCSVAVSGAVFAYIAYMVFQGKLQVGDYSLFTGALNSIIACSASFVSLTAVIYEGTLFIDNLIGFLNEKKGIVPIEGEGLDVRRHIKHEIVFDHVSFSYPGSDREVIKDLSLTLHGGETLVIVGLNGAGKTTLIKLLTRLYDPTKGRILLDGIDIRRYDPKKLYSIFGIIFQDFGKYAFTVRENIAFGDIDREFSEEEIVEAGIKSSADEFVEKLPKKYGTPLMKYFESDGVEPSVGQWQKLSVARAFYSDSDIMILDEPTASLDPLAEQEIFRQFDELRRDKTTIFISHRLSSAQIASKIIVMQDGQIIEEGTHGELMDAKGKYFELFSAQAEKYSLDKVSPEA